MQYALLIYIDPEANNGDSEEQRRATTAEYMDLRAKPGMFGGGHLRPVDTATTVRVRNGRMSITDGPFAETKEQLAGFYLIEARDLNDAIQQAAKIPPAREGSIEVRPVRQLDPEKYV